MKLLRALLALALPLTALAAEPVQISGIYPHLAMYNKEGECGTGAVVPWADRLWVITYGPHLPNGSSDKLYEITPALEQIIRPESVGGTPANRLIHRESQQLFIGPYAIAADGTVRTITPKQMFGRLTGLARHLTDPTGKIVYATMEEGIYEVDVKTLGVTELWADEQRKTGRHADLPGYHGKGFYSAQGRYIYANNGDHAKAALSDPTTPSGVLAEWDGKADAWTVVRRNQFTDVTGPGGIYGSEKPETDPVWSIGWDAKSLILMLLDGGQWQSFRLPKASHSYDGAHGWNTEWPRIREIGEQDLLMTMHGMFWKFPRTFSATNSAGIAPRSTYLKVIGDFAKWQDRVVFGCDDTAKSEFLNKRKVKGEVAAPEQSQSNLWFVKPEQLDNFGPVSSHGAVWLNDDVKAGTPSDPFLFAGAPRRSLSLSHDSDTPVTFVFEANAGDGVWKSFRKMTVPAHGARWTFFPPEQKGAWVRLTPDRDAVKVTADFHLSAPDERPLAAAPIFTGTAPVEARDYSGGLIRAGGEKPGYLSFAAATVKDGKVANEGYYELDPTLKLRRVENDAAFKMMKEKVAVPKAVISSDAASVLVVDDRGRRWRLPKGDAAFDTEGALPLRVDREVCTERDLFQTHGTFFELPAENADGFAKMRAITTHDRRITDYCTWRGLFVMAGVAADAPKDNAHIVRSDDGTCALWVGAVDDLWQFGRPVGSGGPWKDTDVKPGVPSDPYLMHGYENRLLTLEHNAKVPVKFTIEVDVLGTGQWQTYKVLELQPGENTHHAFPPGHPARWVRLKSDQACQASAIFKYD
jgi:hypothetical protein